jgi:CBS domain-containing protein
MLMNNKKARELMVPISEYPHIRENATIKDAFYILRKNFEEGRGYRSILVVNDKEQLKGVIGLSDLIRAVEPGFLKIKSDAYQGLSPEDPALTVIWQEMFSEKCRQEAEKPVNEAMTHLHAAVSLDDSIAKVAYLLVMTKSGILPVLDNEKKVIGVVRLVDVFNEIADVVLVNKK